MSHEERGKRTPKDPRRARQDAALESLDRALAQATTLASELSGPADQAGAENPGTNQVSEIKDEESGKPDLYLPPQEKGDLDAELAGLEQRVKNTVEQLGKAEAPSKPPTNSSRPSEAIPDFMSDLTGPVQPPAKRGGPETTSHGPGDAAPAKPTSGSAGVASGLSPHDCAHSAAVISGGAPGVVGNIPPIPQPLRGPAHGFEDAPHDTTTPPAVSRRKLQAGALAMVEKGVKLLDALDRPFRGLSPSVRSALGWVAIATMATSIAVLAAALSAY